MLAQLKQPLSFALAFSLVLHIFILFVLGYVLPGLRKPSDFSPPLQVVLVNSKSSSRPAMADAQAQNNLDGGGNTAEDRRAKSPLPTLSDGTQYSPEQSARRVRQLEREAKRLLTKTKSKRVVTLEKSPQQQETSTPSTGQDLVSRALEIARLEAEIDKDMDAYQKLPRRKYIGARTRELHAARYIEDWRHKLERVGTLNYPEAARQNKIYGTLQLTVAIRADGSVESVDVSQSSGQRILDAAAQRIVRLAAPFPPLPPEILKETDILHITRTWKFTSTDKLESE